MAGRYRRVGAALLLLQILSLLQPLCVVWGLPVGSEGKTRRWLFVATHEIDRRDLWQSGGGRINILQNVVGKARAKFPRRSMILFSSENDDIKSSIASTWINRKKFFVAAVTLMLSSSILLEIYSRIGTLFIKDDSPRDKLLPPSVTSNIQHATLVFHGSGGQDAYTDALMEQLRKGDPSQYTQMVEWSLYSSNIFQASFNGERIGQMAAKELVDLFPKGNNLQTVHLIGVSVGCFAADSAARRLKQILDDSHGTSSSTRPFVQLTLLDPFTQRGIFGLGYGNQVFGVAADYTQQYLNTDDPVPSTNAPLLNSVCYDITNLRPENIFGHDWPVIYYCQSDQCGKVMVQKEQQQAVGSVVVL
ncbi:lipase [Nitzschia inconspicua]|uniref:Lipase n=1 Tax=Nitzschia inconspicua TaxID=303405 RepID=A0A9K3KMQ3_9STRA|nr:lipase [Nitzschia inconspicua]KAG7346519.1 lipase [Nitzschia inconspicua]